MALWTLALLLAACGLVPATADSVKFIEDPVLLRFNQSRTVVRCSIEVEGGVRPRIDFYIDGVLSHISPFLRCNSERVQRYELENGSVPKRCGDNGQTKLHQALSIRTCSSDSSSFNNITIQCRVHSDIDTTVNGTTSSVMNLSYNQRREPRLDLLHGKLVMFLSTPVCPGEDLGKLSLQSLPPTYPTPTSVVVVASTSQSYAQPTATPPPSLPSQSPPATNVNPLDQLSEGQLKLIIYVATGVAAFFALLVVCLVFVLCCIVMKKHRMLKAVPLRQGRRDAVALGLRLGLNEDDKVLPLNNRERGSGSPESTAHQLALHRNSGSSQSGSIHSSDGHEEQGHVRTSVEVRDNHPEMVQTIPSSFPNPLSLHREAEDHDYDYIDDDQPVPNGKESNVSQGAMRADTRARKKNTYVPEYETQPLHLSVSDARSDSSAPFPTALFGPSSMERNTVSPTSQSPVPSTAMDSTPRKQQDYVNRPAHDYVNNRHPSHDYANDNYPRGAVYHNSLMFGAQVHDYKNHQQPGSKVQTLVDVSDMTDSYQELNTVGSTSSLTADPHVSGYHTQYTTSSHLETYSLDLQRAETCRKAARDMGASANGSENVYHTLYPSDGDIASSSTSSDYSLPRDATAVRAATVGAPSDYDTLQAVNSGRVTHVPMKKTSASSARRDSEYTDLEPTNMEGTSDYSTLSGTVTVNISTQTYATSTA